MIARPIRSQLRPPSVLLKIPELPLEGPKYLMRAVAIA